MDIKDRAMLEGTIELMRDCYDEFEKLEEAFGCIIHESRLANSTSFMMDRTTTLLKEAVGDEEAVIETFMWENNFGRIKSGRGNGLKTIEDVINTIDRNNDDDT